MNETEETTLDRIRTFAKDLEIEREKRGLTPAEADRPKLSKEPSKKEPVRHAKPTPPPPTHTRDEKREESKEKSVVKESKPPHKKPERSDFQKDIDEKLSGANVDGSRPKPIRSKKSGASEFSRKQARAFAVGGATIIKDTKPNRGNNLSRIFKAFSEWLKSLTVSKKKKDHAYSVPSAERRKGVIQTATTKSGTSFSADNERIRKAIKERRQRESAGENSGSEPVLIKPSQGWQNQVPDELKGEQDPSEEEPTSEKEKQTDVKEQEPVEQSTSKEKPQEEKPVEEEEVKETVSEPTPEPVEPTPEPAVKISQEPAPALEESVKEEEKAPRPPKSKSGLLERIKNLPDITTNTLSVTAVSVVFIVVVLYFSVDAIMNVLAPTTPEDTEVVANHTILPNTVLVDHAVLTDVPSEFVDEVRRIQPTNTLAATEVRFVNVVGEPLDIVTLMNLLSLTPDRNLVNTTSEIRLLFLNTLNKGLLFRVADTSTARGALLEWEVLMASELDPILNLQDVVGPSQFVDRTIGNRDARVLIYEGNEIMIYGFVDDNTVLIARDIDVFTDVVNQTY